MIEIAPFPARTGTAQPSQRLGERDQVDQRIPGAHLVEPDAVLDLVDRTTQHIAIEGETLLAVGNAQHHVIELAQSERDHVSSLPGIIVVT